MRKRGLAGKLARSTRLTQAEAADWLDKAVSEILLRLKQGQAVDLPGIGVLKPDQRHGTVLQQYPREADQSRSGSKRKRKGLKKRLGSGK